MSIQIVDSLQAGVVGAIIRVTCVRPQTAAEKASGAARVPIDISATTVKELIFLKPSGLVVTKTAVFTTDGEDGALQWVTQAGDVEPWGTYVVQPNIAIPGFTGRGQRVPVEVLKNL
jgi:hypothetical protein